MWGVFGPEGTEVQVSKAIETNAYMIDVYTGAPTEAMTQYNATLKTMTEQIITDIIRGVKPVETFHSTHLLRIGMQMAAIRLRPRVNEWYLGPRASTELQSQWISG